MKQILTKKRLNEAVDTLDNSQLGDFLQKHRKGPVVKRSLQGLEITKDIGQEGVKNARGRVFIENGVVYIKK